MKTKLVNVGNIVGLTVLFAVFLLMLDSLGSRSSVQFLTKRWTNDPVIVRAGAPAYVAPVVTIGKSIRLMLRNGKPVPVQAMDFKNLQTSALTNYFLPFGILLGIIFLSALSLILSSCFQCCALCCCLKSIRDKRVRSVPRWRKILGAGFFLIISVVVVLTAAGNITGHNYLSTALDETTNGTIAVLQNTQSLLSSVDGTVGNVFDSVNQTLYTTVDMANSAVNLAALNTTVLPGIYRIADMLDLTDTGVRVVLANATQLNTAKTDLVTKVTTASTLSSTIVDNTNALTSTFKDIPQHTGFQYRLSSGISVGSVQSSASSVSSETSNIPDSSATLSSFSQIPDLKAYATTARNMASSAQTSAQTTVTSSTSAAIQNFVPTINRMRVDVTAQIRSVTNSPSSTIASILDQTRTFVNMAKGYNTPRLAGAAAIVSLYIFILSIVGASVMFQKPALGKGCNLGATPLYILFHVLALLFTLLAIVLGEVCTIGFEDNYISQFALLGDTGTIAVGVVQQCYANKSLLQMQIGSFNISSQVDLNFTNLVSKQLDNLNFEGSIANLDISNSISLSPSPSQQLSKLTGTDLSALNTTTLDNLITNTIPNLKAELTNLKTRLVTSSNNIVAGALTFNPSTSDSAIQDAAVADYKSRVASITGMIDTLIGSGGSLDIIISGATTIRTDITAVKTSATALINNGTNINTEYNSSMTAIRDFTRQAIANVTARVTDIKSFILTSVGTQTDYVNNQFRCREIAASFYDTRDGLCLSFLGAMDAIWVTYTIIAVASTLSVPIVIMFVNAFSSRPKAKDNEFDSPHYDGKGNKDSGKGKKDQKTGGKEVGEEKPAPGTIVKSSNIDPLSPAGGALPGAPPGMPLGGPHVRMLSASVSSQVIRGSDDAFAPADTVLLRGDTRKVPISSVPPPPPPVFDPLSPLAGADVYTDESKLIQQEDPSPIYPEPSEPYAATITKTSVLDETPNTEGLFKLESVQEQEVPENELYPSVSALMLESSKAVSQSLDTIGAVQTQPVPYEEPQQEYEAPSTQQEVFGSQDLMPEENPLIPQEQEQEVPVQEPVYDFPTTTESQPAFPQEQEYNEENQAVLPDELLPPPS